MDPEDFDDQVFGVVVTEQSLAPQALLQELARQTSVHPRRQWLNMYVDVHSFCGLYVSPEPVRFFPRPNDAVAVVLTDPAHQDGVALLLDFAMHLSNFLRVSEYLDYPPRSTSGSAGP